MANLRLQLNFLVRGGGGDVIDLTRLFNRIADNCAQDSILMSVAEKATEDHNILAKTIYNKRVRSHYNLYSLMIYVCLLCGLNVIRDA